MRETTAWNAAKLKKERCRVIVCGAILYTDCFADSPVFSFERRENHQEANDDMDLIDNTM